MKLFEGAFATALVAGGEVDEEGAIVEGGFGVLEGELADYGEANALRVLLVVLVEWMCVLCELMYCMLCMLVVVKNYLVRACNYTHACVRRHCSF